MVIAKEADRLNSGVHKHTHGKLCERKTSGRKICPSNKDNFGLEANFSGRRGLQFFHLGIKAQDSGERLERPNSKVSTAVFQDILLLLIDPSADTFYEDAYLFFSRTW
ncbi:hypothetical protein ILYODFUR_009840 [Ilyodon furcidens]|uniref:Uncharacterized protein n=1 Tax=Ilyodon furcidens TaxID=33524 RepID=A0ABV0U442_9TELE